MTSDQEPAIRDLKNSFKKISKADVMMEETPVGDSKSAGSIENYMKQVQGMIRTFIIHIETRLGATIPEDHMIIPWIVKHAAATINRFCVGEDGFTAHRRLRGRNFPRGRPIFQRPFGAG